MTKKAFFFFLTAIALCLTLPSYAQQQTIRGTITDAQTKKPVAGVTVSVKGATAATAADDQGNFTITAPANATLIFQSVGYATQELPAADEMQVALVLQPEDLGEVVVVGARMRKSDLTGAVTDVNTKALMERPVTNINQALQGNAPGVFISPGTRPGDDATIRIRGTNTINAGSTPIFVVDGVVMENNQGGFNAMNLNDVASVQVLKDASATALYGSRGANGVVVVTTKKGARSGGDGRITYDAWVGISKIARIPERLNAQQLFELRLDAYANGYLKDNPGANRQDYIDNVLMKNEDNKYFSAQEMAAYNSGKSYNWLDEVTHNGLQQNHVLGFSGGSDRGTFYLSAGYAGIKGIIENTKQDKYTGRFNADYNIKKWLKVGTNTGFTRTNDAMPSDDVYNKALNANPLLDFAPYRDPATRYIGGDDGYLTLYYKAHGEQNNNDFNPFNSLEIQRDRSRNRLTSSNFIAITPAKGWEFRSTYALDYAAQDWFEFTPHNIQEAVRHYNGDARAKHERWSDTYWQWDNTLTYNTTFSGDHRLMALVGTSASKRSANYTKAQGDRFASDDLSYHDLGGAAAIEKSVLGSDFYNYSLMSYLVRATYNYKDRYMLTGTARYDGSSRFSSGNQWGVFPSVSAAWVITNENFMKDQTIFDQLKLRAGYGVVGNQDIGNYAFQTLYGSLVNNGNALIANDGRRGNPDITWERQKQSNIGVDMSLLKSRLNITADFYSINNDNLLLDRSLATTVGYTKEWQNVGRVNNKGMEFSVTGNVVRTSDWNWTLSGNISFDRNKVTKLYADATEIFNINENVIQREGNIFLGKPVRTIYDLSAVGIATEANRSEWEHLNFNGVTVNPGDLFARDISGPDGKPDGIVSKEYDRIVVAGTDPKFYGGFGTNLSYKTVELNANFTYSHGARKISSYYEGLIGSIGESMASADLLNRWTPEHPDATIPRVIGNTGYSRYSPSDVDYYIQNASFLRLSALTLSYTLPSRITDAWKLNTLRFYATGSNLFCITPYKGFDPETGDYGYPPVKMFVFGVNVSL
ncbi:SusC/RagA family TonB-linked outer membrane protein [Niabella beijingensis]|uniref:SusC/RagA family TonB-linked outer membrane protein n=1 Tax=Niabella beijingensis TaxID=2872700 RepID=UPI001CBCA4F4|nr:TonB-dependent receptor [Niabella beijingensis]MBZ4189166.1 TonB-dependent receptor [Niabella beijingensis]